MAIVSSVAVRPHPSQDSGTQGRGECQCLGVMVWVDRGWIGGAPRHFRESDADGFAPAHVRGGARGVAGGH